MLGHDWFQGIHWSRYFFRYFRLFNIRNYNKASSKKGFLILWFLQPKNKENLPDSDRSARFCAYNRLPVFIRARTADRHPDDGCLCCLWDQHLNFNPWTGIFWPRYLEQSPIASLVPRRGRAVLHRMAFYNFDGSNIFPKKGGIFSHFSDIHFLHHEYCCCIRRPEIRFLLSLK